MLARPVEGVDHAGKVDVKTENTAHGADVKAEYHDGTNEVVRGANIADDDCIGNTHCCLFAWGVGMCSPV